MAEDVPARPPAQISLNSRQVFFVFFGFSVVGCLLFTVGVMVGRKMPASSSAHVAEALDAEGSDPNQAPVAPSTKDADMAFREGLRTPDPAAKPASPPAPAAAPTDDAAVVASKPAVIPPGPAAAVNPVASAKPAAAAPAAPAASAVASDEPTPAGSNGERTYTLEIRNFTTQEEAEAFAKTLQAQGYSARSHTKNADTKPKYRVLVGNYANEADARTAKESFEKAVHRIGYVTRAP